MFTFSFGSAFATTTYSYSDYKTAFAATKAAEMAYVEGVAATAINTYTYDDNGFTEINGVNYMAAAIEAAAAEIVDQVEALIDAAIKDALADYDSGTEPSSSSIIAVIPTYFGEISASNELTVAAFIEKLQSTEDNDDIIAVLNSTQAPLTKAYVEAKLAAVDYSLYNSTDKNCTITGDDGSSEDVTAVAYIEYLVATAEAAIATAAEESDDADKISGYEDALEEFETELAKVATLEEEELTATETVASVAAAVNGFLNFGLGEEYEALVAVVVKGASFEDMSTFEDFCDSSAKTMFGVSVSDVTSITTAEATAIRKAYIAAVEAAAEVLTQSGLSAEEIAALYTDEDAFLTTLKNAMDAADLYAEVIAYGEKLKVQYLYGVKLYDDEAIDEAVAAAEAAIYANFGGDLGSATDYLDEDALLISGSNLEAFKEAIAEAQAKFFSDVDSKTATTAVKYGTSKTAEEDYVYLKATYASTDASAWEAIAVAACEALEQAQSYAEIEEIMAQAEEALSALMLAADASDVAAAVTEYEAALDAYSTYVEALLDSTAYTGSQMTDAVAAGKALIEAAKTVDEVAAAYAKAQAIVDSVLSDAELKTMAAAVDALIDALPHSSEITADDYDAVMAAYEAYLAYVETPGASAENVEEDTLEAALDAVLALKVAEIAAAAEELYAEMSALGTSDSDLAAYIALKADAEALVADGAALADIITAIELEITTEAEFGDDYEAIEAALKVEAGFYAAEVEYAASLLVQAVKDGATAADMKAALEAYENLSERQQYELDSDVLSIKNLVTKSLISTVTSLKITASSSAKKGSITVKWTTSGDATGIDGYRIYRSTKRNSGYGSKPYFITTKTSYKNTKNLKSGTRYYYKVRAYVEIDGVKYYSDWSNKAYRKAK